MGDEALSEENLALLSALVITFPSRIQCGEETPV